MKSTDSLGQRVNESRLRENCSSFGTGEGHIQDEIRTEVQNVVVGSEETRTSVGRFRVLPE